jgi:HPt (histidine-containing phosphotransfer) domain-containing protein
MEKPNLSYIYHISRGDKAFEKKLLDLLKKEYKEERLGYEKGVDKGDTKLSGINVHKLKHKMGILGLKEGSQVASRYEEELLKGSFKSKEEFEAILEVMDQYLELI